MMVSNKAIEFFQIQNHSETPIFLSSEKNGGYEFGGFMLGLNNDTPRQKILNLLI